MVDVDRRITNLNPSHVAGLRRLYARASATPSLPSRNSHLSHAPLAQTLITLLKSYNIHLHPGLSEPELARSEAQFGFTFPPDLRAVLSSALPVGPAFPDWRSPRHVRASLDLPIAAVSLQIARNALWCKSWGPRPGDPEKAIRVARNSLKRAPVLIPVFGNCYIPCRPCLAGNPVFFVDKNRILCCGSDLADFFQRESVFRKPDPDTWHHQKQRSEKSAANFSRRSLDTFLGSRVGSEMTRKPRWVEFWSDAAVYHRRRNSSSMCPSPDDGMFDLPRVGSAKWVKEYMDEIGSTLKTGGWSESDVNDIVSVSGSGFMGDETVIIDNQAVFDALLLKAGRLSDSLRLSGWSSEEVSDVLGFDIRVEKVSKPAKKLTPGLVERIEKPAQSVSR